LNKLEDISGPGRGTRVDDQPLDTGHDRYTVMMMVNVTAKASFYAHSTSQTCSHRNSQTLYNILKILSYTIVQNTSPKQSGWCNNNNWNYL